MCVHIYIFCISFFLEKTKKKSWKVEFIFFFFGPKCPTCLVTTKWLLGCIFFLWIEDRNGLYILRLGNWLDLLKIHRLSVIVFQFSLAQLHPISSPLSPFQMEGRFQFHIQVREVFLFFLFFFFFFFWQWEEGKLGT